MISSFANAKRTFDKFHILKIITKAADGVRSQEVDYAASAILEQAKKRGIQSAATSRESEKFSFAI
jgi:transposase